MRFRRTIAIPVIACSLGLAAGLVGVGAVPVQAAVSGGSVLALTSANTIVGFNAATPGTLTQTTQITGLQIGESVVGFDVRPATGELFAVGVTGATGRMYVINSSNGAATLVGSGPFSTALPTGGTWSVDFNPAVDRIRFVHSSGVNLRLNPLNGTLAATDTAVATAKPTALAYDRSTSPAPTATTLFAIDDVADTLNLIGGLNGTPSPNGGVTSPVGPLGVNADSASIGFDIAPQGDALATLSVGGVYGLYTLNLTTGAATLVGAVGAGTLELRDIALPRPPVGAMLALTTGNTLLRFDAAAPGVTTSQAITGLAIGETIVGIDVRPATGEVIGVGLVGTEGRVYRIDPTTGTATQLGSTPFAVTAVAPTWAVDFNPTVDRIRFTNSLGDSYRLNPLNGALAGTDTDIAPAKPSAVAYDRSVATTTATTLYAIDDVADTLNTIGGPDSVPSPNLGATIVRGPLGVATDSDLVGFDISPIGEGVASLSVGGVTGLYTIELATGAAQPIGPIGNGTVGVIDVAFVARFAAGASQFTPVTPTRLLDTRDGVKPAANSSTDLQVTGMAGVPANATAIVLNTTATQATAAGFITVYPTGETRPVASNLNLMMGQTQANLVTVKVGAGGSVSMYTEGGAHMIADVFGYYAPATGTAGRYTALPPSRLLDTRSTTKIDAGDSVDVPVLGEGGVPATGVSAVALNVTVDQPTSSGYLTTWPTGEPMPTASTHNFVPGLTAANLVLAKVGANGQVSMFNSAGSTHLVADVVGYFSSQGGTFVPVTPSRLVDTRDGTGGVVGPIGQGSSFTAVLAGGGTIPPQATAVVVNVTSANSTAPSFVTAWPSGTGRPVASTMNPRPGVPVPNQAYLKLGSAGELAVFNNSGNTDVVIDVFGYVL